MFFKRLGVCTATFFGLFRVLLQVVYGTWRLSKHHRPFVSIFGGARLSQESPYAQQANDLARRLVESDISVLTGGGSGVMYAANCGAMDSKKTAKGRSIGIGVKDLEEGKNPCTHEHFELDYFFARKWLMTRFSEAFIVFPGGFGTMDELAEVLTLIKTKKLERAPIVLIGTEYWKHFMQWIHESAIPNDLILKSDMELFLVTDDFEEAFCTVRDECELKRR